jgi:hypothetical protein
MKKILAVIATILGVVPFLSASALYESTNYYTYSKGEVVNFYTNEEEENAKTQDTGLTTMILEDKGANDKYVKALLIGSPYSPAMLMDELDTQGTIRGSRSWEEYISLMRNTLGFDDTDKQYIYNMQDTAKGMNYPSLDEILDLFGEGNYTYDATSKIYTLTNKTIKDRSGADTTIFNALEIMIDGGGKAIKGFYTSTFDGTKIWVVKFNTMDIQGGPRNAHLIGVTIEQVEANENTEYAALATVYVNKTADCHQSSFMCYVCGTEYKYAEVCSQDASCKEVPGITNPADCVPQACYNCEGSYKWYKEGEQDATKCTKVDTITTPAKCVDSPDTGLESHILEFAIVAALCAIALLAVRKKDLFRTI